MKWYQGDIRQAVVLSQTQKAVFFVGIFGTDESSQELEATLNSDEVQVVVSSDEFVCLRLEADSEPHKQFAAIYANAKAPSIYCITDKGVPVDIITEPIPGAELRSRLELARNRHREVLGVRVQGSTPTLFTPPPAPASPSPSASASNEPKEESKEPKEASEGSSGQEGQDPAFEDKVRRAKELAQARQLLKMKEEEEEARRKEIERRQAGKGMAELQRWQKEQEAKRILEERKKEREEEKLVRQRLREQIAQDRAARNARSNIEFVEQASTTTASSFKPKPGVTSNTSAAANYAGQARLQFRLPDGSSLSHAFNPDSTLGHVRQFLIDSGSVPFRDFSLWVAFPRRQFTSAEHGNTLRELGLLPSAALLILPVSGLSNNRPGSSGSSLWTLIAYLLGYILYPVSFVWNILQRALPAPSSGSGSASNSTPSPTAVRQTSSTMGGKGNKLGGRALPTDGRGDQNTSSASNPPAGPSGDIPRKAKDKHSSGGSNSSGSSGGGGKNSSGPDGNVHRLRTRESDSDDEKATWNGNSTQQM